MLQHFRNQNLSKIDVKIYKIFAVLLGGLWMHFGTNVGQFLEVILGEHILNSGRVEGRASETPTKNHPKNNKH